MKLPTQNWAPDQPRCASSYHRAGGRDAPYAARLVQVVDGARHPLCGDCARAVVGVAALEGRAIITWPVWFTVRTSVEVAAVLAGSSGPSHIARYFQTAIWIAEEADLDSLPLA